jgi:fibrillarin-like pre-rRNA processing protein
MESFIRDGDRIYTVDRFETGSIYGEKIDNIGNTPCREWIPWRSKLGALLKKREDIIFPSGDILYLGAAQGTTVSHISDMLDGNIIYAVEFSQVAYRKLSSLAKKRDNIIPILADGFHPERYSSMVPPVEIIYQDVSQKDQVGMFQKNARSFLKNGGKGFLMVKARSIDVTSSPENIYGKVITQLKEGAMKIETKEDLSPFQKDHCAILTTYNE